ncbi:MAG: TolC family protein [Alistipes sp.]|nr:TolC family protein [Alistipes sp.]
MRQNVFLLLSVIFSISASAQISLDEYRSEVLSRSLDVHGAVIESDRAYAESRVERTEFLPELSVDGNFTTAFKREDKADLWGFSVEPRIEQTIYAGGRVRAAYRQSLLRYSMAQQDLEQVKLDVSFAADDAYWSVSAMQLYMAATEEYVNIIRSLYNVVQERYREGYVSHGDLLQVEARLSDAEFSRIAIRKNYDAALHRFNNLRREPDSLAVVLTNSIIDSLAMPVRVALDEIMQCRPDVKVAQQSVDIAEYGVRIEQAKYNPSLSAGVSGSWQTYSPNHSAKTYWDGALVVGLNVPIFYWGERRHAVAAAQRGVELQEIHLEELHEEISLEEADGWSALVSSYSQMQSSLKNVDIASRNLAISTYSYQEGQATLLDVLQAQISWIQIYTNAITARYNYAVAWSAYRRITAQN